MASRFCRFTQKEFEEFLKVLPNGKPEEKGGWYRITLPGVRELVYSKLLTPDLSLRIYSTLEDGFARDVGSDAIRICVAWRPCTADQQHYEKMGLAKPFGDRPIWPMIVGGEAKVLRVHTWRANLQNRLQDLECVVPPICECGAPQVYRMPKSRGGVKPTWSPFWGCVWMRNCPKKK